MPFFINLLLIEAKLLPQSSYFASNIFRFGEEPDKFTKMLPEPNNTILMSVLGGYIDPEIFMVEYSGVHNKSCQIPDLWETNIGNVK